MVGDFFRLYTKLYTESVGDSGYIPYIPNSPTGGHSGRKTSHGGRIRYIYNSKKKGELQKQNQCISAISQPNRNSK